MRKVAQIMGMPITVDIPGCGDEAVFADIFNWFREVDERFSTYKESSEVSRFARGEITKPSRMLEDVINACRKAEDETDGYFSAWAGGKFDPSGYVKGWTIAEAGKLVENKGYKTYCISAGGDILARSDSEKEWAIGIQDPASKDSIISVIRGKNIAVATSGNYERGTHIINPKTGQSAEEYLSLTVVGPEIIWADTYATAGFAAGPDKLQSLNIRKGYEVLGIAADGRIVSTPGMSKLLAAS